jgi:hypothetical protein
MSKITYFLIEGSVKDICDDLSLIESTATEASIDELKNQDHGSGISVMSLCDNFITIYGHPTWKKKFGK